MERKQKHPVSFVSIGVFFVLMFNFSWAGLLWISNTLYLVDSLIYWAAWYNKFKKTEGDEKPNPCFDGYKERKTNVKVLTKKKNSVTSGLTEFC